MIAINGCIIIMVVIVILMMVGASMA